MLSITVGEAMRMGIMALGATVCMVVALWAPVWVWDDVAQRGKQPLPSALLVLVTSPVGLICWLVFRPDRVDASQPRRVMDGHAKSASRGG